MWLKTLNASARNCSLHLSERLKFLNTEVSASQYPGPMKVLRPRLPTQPRQGAEKELLGKLRPLAHWS